MFGTFSHGWGWPVAKGGSIAITRAMASLLQKLGGRIETGHRVTELPQADLVLLDTSPDQALTLAGDRAPWHVRRSLRKWRYGPGTFKVDLAVEGGVPWTNELAHRAGTVHLGGEIEEVNAAEQAIAAGRMPERPFVIVCQQHLADPSRSAGDVHPIWAYAHVPHGYTGDATEAVMGQIERFAPGFRDRVLATAVRGPQAWQQYNANYVGGDIAGGANDPWQVVMRPRMSPDPYKVADGVYLCSASTPPGGGVHGMSGFQAAVRALRSL
jgi:phytoene dehydrogenase-like protein